MLNFSFKSASKPELVLAALGKSFAIIEFDLDGTILEVNENFSSAFGYTPEELKGQHHRIFVDAQYAQSPTYKAFWEKLRHGEFEASEYKRFGKKGQEIWIQASYNPVKNRAGQVIRVVKVATVITDTKLKNAEFESKIAAISRVQAVIEFKPSGEIITANEIFLNLMGYRLDEVKGQHHRIFVDPAYTQSAAYRDFWSKLNAGDFVTTSFKRIAKGGKEVWLQASYNPIFDMNMKVVKVVKFASDITDLTEIGVGLAKLAESNLHHRIERPFIPAFEKLRTDYNVAQENLRSTMVRITESTGAIQSGTRDIAAAADNLAHRTEQQAASLEETAAALATITDTVKRASDGAINARDIVAEADADAKKSTVIVRQAVVAMDGIADSARKISQIIGVIDEIAFQTNLLALNAGVEAARAGDAGRGFAVVASEVRALAQRSAEAAKEIKSLIMESTAQVEQGVKLVGQTGSSLARIMTQVADINAVVTEIASGAKEQAQGLEEVNVAVTQMDQATQQNAAMVEESTAATHSISAEVSQLSVMIGQFELGDGAQPSSTVRLLRPGRDAGRPVGAGIAPGGLPKVVNAEAPGRSRSPARRVANGTAVSTADGWEEF